MSETKHSPEPWVVKHGRETGRAQAIDDALNLCVVKWGGLGAKATVGTPNARRIVACVNACAGIPTEALESGALGKALDSAAWVLDCERNLGKRPVRGMDEAIEGAVFALRSLGRLK